MKERVRVQSVFSKQDIHEIIVEWSDNNNAVVELLGYDGGVIDTVFIEASSIEQICYKIGVVQLPDGVAFFSGLY